MQDSVTIPTVRAVSPIWTSELIEQVAADRDRGYEILYGPDSYVWDSAIKKMIKRSK